jgi:hypothetical protein
MLDMSEEKWGACVLPLFLLKEKVGRESACLSSSQVIFVLLFEFVLHDSNDVVCSNLWLYHGAVQ